MPQLLFYLTLSNFIFTINYKYRFEGVIITRRNFPDGVNTANVKSPKIEK